jgi:thiol-disulfide isomerase/thioredoxin
MRAMFDPEGAPMAGFELPALQEGKSISLSDYEGKALFLTFFATWCGPCRVELPVLQRLYEEYGGEEFTILAVNVAEPRETVEPFVDELGLTLPVALDTDGSVKQSTFLRGVPMTLVLNQEHEVVELHQGFPPGAEQRMIDEIGELLGNPEDEGTE